MINFLQDTPSDNSKAKSLQNTIISPSAAQDVDNFVISEFITTLESIDSGLFVTLKKLYYGVLISEFILNIQQNSSDDDFSDLIVFYDTTVLLRLLGVSGSLHKRATNELHDSLVSLGCKTFYFDHILDEAQEVIDAVVRSLNSNDYGRLFDETAEAIIQKEVDPAYIRSLPAEIGDELKALNIYEFHHINRRENPPVFDEEEFEDQLSKTRSVTQSARDERDAKSLGLVMSLRKKQSESQACR